MSLLDIWPERELFSARYGGRRVTITQKGTVKTLRCNDVIFSRIDSSSLYTHEYWDFFMPLAYLFDRPRILMIGLGGGTIASQFSRLLKENLSLEIVEIDKEMAGICTKFLGGEMRCRIIIGKGEDYVSSNKKSYDILILDAYDEYGKIPAAFLEKKFVAEAYDSLKEKGIFGVNCIGSMLGPGLDSFLQNLSERFEVYRLETSNFTANIVLICTKNIGKEELLEKVHSEMKPEKENAFLMKAYDSSKRVFLTI